MVSYIRFRGSLAAETPEAARANDTASVTYAPGLIYQAPYSCLDSEISGYLPGNIFYLRVSEGKALYLADIGGNPTVGWVTSGLDVTSTSYPSNKQFREGKFLIKADLPGYTGDAITDVWTFGAVGFDVYVKYNGTEVLRFKEYAVLDAGPAAVWGGAGVSGSYSVTVSYLPATLFSNRARKALDLRDFGLKTTAPTTGSITAGSPTLTVASSTGFEIGDHVIVEIGGEAGLGYRGTMGVGGAWPALSYADATAMNADTSKGGGTYAWNRATGFVYIYNGSAWVQNLVSSTSIDQGFHYTEKALPYALCAEIIGKAGNVLTLDTNATASATSASVHYDAYYGFFPWTDNGEGYEYVRPSGIKVVVPAGTYALGQALLSGTNGELKPGHQMIGRSGKDATTLFSPKGTRCISVGVTDADGARITGLTLRGNHVVGASGEIDGFQFTSNPSAGFTGVWPYTIRVYRSDNSIIRDIDVENVLSSAVSVSTCTNTWAYNCTLNQDHGALAYTQWYMGQDGSFGGGYVDCTVNCPKLIKAFESFSCYPDPATGIGTTYLRCGGQNALFSPNSSIGLKLYEWDSTTTEDAFGFLNAGFFGEAILNISANAFHTAVDAHIRNPRVRQLGYVRSSDQTTMIGIQVSPDCVGVIIEGEYAGETTPFSDALGGYILAPDWVNAADNSFRDGTSVAITDGGSGTIIRGIRAVGVPSAAFSKSAIENALAVTAGTIEDCVADSFAFKVGTTKSGNRTNAGVSVP